MKESEREFLESVVSGRVKMPKRTVEMAKQRLNEVAGQHLDRQAANYDDFAVCSHCQTVNLRANQKCTKCGNNNTFQTFETATAAGCGVIAAWVIGLAAVPLLFLFPIGTAIGGTIIGIAQNVHKRSKLNATEKRNRYQREAIELMGSLAKDQRREAEESYDVGLRDFESGSFESAIEHLKSAIQLGRDDVKVRFALAASYYNLKNYASSIPMLEAIIKEQLPPDGSRELLARSYIAVGISSKQQADFLIQQKATFVPKLKEASTLTAARFLEANSTTEPECVPVLEEACDLEPSASEHVTALVRIMVEERNWAQGIAYASRLGLDDLDADGVGLYARCLSEANDLSDGAVAVYAKHLNGHPEDTDIRMRMAQAQIRSKHFTEAITTYQGGLARNGSNIKLRYHLALANLMADEVEDSIAELQALLRTDGFEAYRSKDDIYRLLGRCFIRKGMLEAALKQYLLAERSPENIEELYGLGELFEPRGDDKSARACWEEIYATDVRFRDISAKIAAAGS